MGAGKVAQSTHCSSTVMLCSVVAVYFPIHTKTTLHSILHPISTKLKLCTHKKNHLPLFPVEKLPAALFINTSGQSLQQRSALWPIFAALSEETSQYLWTIYIEKRIKIECKGIWFAGSVLFRILPPPYNIYFKKIKCRCRHIFCSIFPWWKRSLINNSCPKNSTQNNIFGTIYEYRKLGALFEKIVMSYI